MPYICIYIECVSFDVLTIFHLFAGPDELAIQHVLLTSSKHFRLISQNKCTVIKDKKYVFRGQKNLQKLKADPKTFFPHFIPFPVKYALQ